MMQSCASTAKFRGGGPILSRGLKAKSTIGLPPPRFVVRNHPEDDHGAPARYGRENSGRAQGQPSGTMPHVASRQSAMSSLRARATTTVLRVPPRASAVLQASETLIRPDVGGQAESGPAKAKLTKGRTDLEPHWLNENWLDNCCRVNVHEQISTLGYVGIVWREARTYSGDTECHA